MYSDFNLSVERLTGFSLLLIHVITAVYSIVFRGGSRLIPVAA